MMQDTRGAYLVHSPGFASAFCGWFVCLGLLSQLLTKYATLHWMSTWQSLHVELLIAASSWQWSGVLGLLSSACCLLQVILNVFSLGCAGFNTYLGPMRPFFLSCTVLLQLQSWSLAGANPLIDTRYVALSSSIAASLAMMPEVLYLYHQCTGGARTKASSVITLKLEGMGCISCATTVRDLALKHRGTVEATVSVNDGIATIYSTLEVEAATKAAQQLADECTAAKFPCTVAGINSSDDDSSNGNRPAISMQPSGWATAIVAGLASSSCCVLQLALNVLSSLDVIHVGCTGFNKWLGPVRSPLRALTVATLLAMWSRPKSRSLRLLVQSLLTLMLMLAPEMLLLSGGPAIAPATADVSQFNITVDGMGCEACQVHVQKLLEKSSGVVGARADFETGLVQLHVANDWGFNMNSTRKLLADDGYPVLSISPQNIETEQSQVRRTKRH